MACAAGPNIIEDGLILNIDPINLEKNLTSNTSTNFLQNGSFSGGLGVTYEAGSNPTNTIIELENPGDSQYVLRQNGNNTEYQMNIDGGAQGTLSASTQYVMSGWYAKSSDYNGGDTMFHARAFSSSDAHNATGTDIGTLLYSKVVGGLTWEFRYQTITTPSDYSGDFDWYMGYGTNNSAGYRYYTGLKVEEGSFPSALDLSRNGNEGKVKGATFNSDGYFEFDGTDDQLSSVSIPNPNGELTCEVAMNYDSKGEYHNIFDRGSSRPMLWIDSNNKLEVSFSTASGGITSSDAYNGQDIVVTAVYNSNSSPGILLYVNGNLVGTQNTTHVTWTNPSTFTLFNRNNAQTFDGKLYYLKFYTKALSASEIKQNFNALRGRFGI